jgi:phage tail tube protein FII
MSNIGDIVERFESLKRLNGVEQSISNLPDCEYRDALIRDIERFKTGEQLLAVKLQDDLDKLRNELAMCRGLYRDLMAKYDTLVDTEGTLGILAALRRRLWKTG